MHGVRGVLCVVGLVALVSQVGCDLEDPADEADVAILADVAAETDAADGPAALRVPNCHARVPARAWRIRNATRSRANAWSLRGLRFCTKDDCSKYITGDVIDDGSAPHWGPPEALFDDDNGNFWKAFAGRRPGQAFVGLESNRANAVTHIGIRPNNVVYGVSEIYVEYYDNDSESWVTHTLLEDVPLHYGDIGSGGPTYKNDVWYVAPLKRCGKRFETAEPVVVLSE